MEATKCPVCKSPVRIMRRKDGSADHYETLRFDDLDEYPNPISPILADYLRAARNGKRTVAITGSSWSSGPWAPYGETEVWCANEMHGKPWVDEKSATAWFQIHPKSSFTSKHRFDHWGWLQKEHGFPIYMIRKFDDVPDSVPYPLREIQRELIGNFIRGEEKMEKLFSSTMSYQIALALHQKRFDRIELFGIELLLEGEYAYQRDAMAFWLGKADGMGIDIWMPESCALLVQPLYGYEEIRKGDSGEVVWSK